MVYFVYLGPYYYFNYYSGIFFCPNNNCVVELMILGCASLAGKVQQIKIFHSAAGLSRRKKKKKKKIISFFFSYVLLYLDAETTETKMYLFTMVIEVADHNK